jgi:CheY-like chemotaxis protein
MDMTDKVVKLIEDSHEDADLHQQLLEAAGKIRIEYVPARPSVDDYADLAADPGTGAVMIDERLGEFAGVDYTGLEVADFLRTLRPELPIYILTNYANEIADDQGESVEFIIDKKTVRKAAKVYVARILRAMQQYEAALTDQQRQLKELIDRKLAGELSEEEEAELQQLRAAIERPFGPAEIEQERQWNEELQRQEEQLERLEKIAREIQQAARKGDEK